MGKGGSAVPKPEVKQRGFFSGDLNFVYSGKTGFQWLQLFSGAEQREPLQPPALRAGWKRARCKCLLLLSFHPQVIGGPGFISVLSATRLWVIFNHPGSASTGLGPGCREFGRLKWGSVLDASALFLISQQQTSHWSQCLLQTWVYVQELSSPVGREVCRDAES